MIDGITAKFAQNYKLTNFLSKFKDHNFVECNAYDSFWGIGLSLNNPDVMDRKKWKGKNILGECLDQVLVRLLE